MGQTIYGVAGVGILIDTAKAARDAGFEEVWEFRELFYSDDPALFVHEVGTFEMTHHFIGVGAAQNWRSRQKTDPKPIPDLEALREAIKAFLRTIPLGEDTAETLYDEANFGLHTALYVN